MATKVSSRIGILNNDWQQAQALFNKGDEHGYEREALRLYGLLRTTWERALEEVLFCGVVERYRESVQTRQITSIADIETQDCEQLNSGMTKCSKWVGHDLAGAAAEQIPEPGELKDDIELLEAWVARIRERRQDR